MNTVRVHFIILLSAIVLGAIGIVFAQSLSPNLLATLRNSDETSAQSTCPNAFTGGSFGGFTFTRGCFSNNQPIYTNDNRHVFFQLPSNLANAAYVKTPNVEIKDNPSLSWSINLASTSTVYVMVRHIPNLNTTPSWVSSQYTRRTTNDLGNLNQYFLRKNELGLIGVYDIWSRTASGQVTFGTAASPDSSAYSMYIVAVVPSSGQTTAPTTAPTNPATASPRPGGTATSRPATASPRPTTQTAGPTAPPLTPGPTLPPVSGDFPCGRFPNASAGCMNVSFQSWYDNVAASTSTMNVNYTPRLLHQHYECAVPQARANGQYLKQGMKLSCMLIRYNSIVPYLSSNSGRYDSCNQGSCYENFTLNLPACQSSKYEGKECKSENVHNVRATDMNSATEMRFRPNADFTAMGDGRHFVSSNWQTGIGYRSSSEFTTRYWIDQCGTYQRTILTNVDKFHKGSEPIPTVSGSITIPFVTNGGCGSQFKTFAFLDPTQHVTAVGAQGGTTLLETNGHYNGNLTWDTTKTSNGIHSILFINMEGTGNYVAAAGVALRFNVQN